MTDTRNRETHPSFGVAIVGRTSATPGAPMFQSDLLHRHYITLRIETAERIRDLNHDWVHPLEGLIEIRMSLAQWGALISSQGIGSGVPVTIERRESGSRIEDPPFAPRMQENLNEVDATFHKTYERVIAATAALNEAIDGKMGAKIIRERQSNLNAAVQNVGSNAKFAVDSLTRASEKVVSAARSDIEASILNAQRITGGQASIESPTIPAPRQIEETP